MANEYLNILVKVNKDTGELEVVKQQLTNLDGAAKGTSQSTKDLGSAFSFLKSLLPIISIGMLVNQLKSCIMEGEQSAEVMRKLTFAMKENGVYTDENVKLLEKQSRYIQEVSRVSDEEYLSSVNRALNMTGNLNTSLRIVNASMGIMKNTDMSMSQAMLYLSWAINGNERGLSMLARSGLGSYIDKSKSAHDNAVKLIKVFEEQYKDNDSLTGSFKQLGNQISEVKESIGKALAPALIDMFKDLNKQIKPTLTLLVQLGKAIDSKHIEGMTFQINKWTKELSSNRTEIMELQEKYEKLVKRGEKASDMYSEAEIRNVRNEIIALEKKNAVLQSNVDNYVIDRKETIESKEIKESALKELNALTEQNTALINKNSADSKQNDEEKIERLKKLEEITLEYNNKIRALDAFDFEAKRNIIRKQMDEELEKVALLETGKTKISKDEFKKWKKNKESESKAKIAIEKYTAEQIEKINKEETIRKTENAQKVFEISRTFLEAGLTLMGEEFKKRKEWAIAMIALDKAIAIMAAIAAGQRMALETGNPGLAWAYAAAQIALITAQAVQQIRALNESSSNVESSSSDSGSTSNPLTTESHTIGGSSTSSIDNSSGSGAESGKINVNVSFNVIDPTNLTADAQEKMARWLKNVLANENNR